MFNKILRQERKNLNLTQEQLSKKINTSRQNITNWETGYSIPSIELLTKLADFFECSTDYLLGKSSYKNIGDEFDNNTNLISLRNDTKVLDNISGELKLEETSAEKLLSELKQMGLLNDNEELTDEKLNIILDFIRNNKDMLKILLNK